MKRMIVPIIILMVVLQACATVGPPVTAIVPKSESEESKTISQSQRSLKRKVAIARFSNETKYGQGFFYDAKDDRLGKQAMDILSARLTATGKFIMLERVDLSHLTNEKEISNLATMNIAADYLILGSVSEFGRRTTSDVGVFSRTKKQTAFAKVNVRLVDVKTSQIVYSEEGEGEAFSEAQTTMGIGNTADYDASLNDKVISAAISKLVNRITENLLDRPWRSYVLSSEDGKYYISGGNLQGLKEGDVFAVYKRGQLVNNPQSGKMIELPGKVVARLRVLSTIPGEVDTELSLCEKTEGELPAADFHDYYIQEK